MSLDNEKIEYSELKERFPKFVKWAEKTLHDFKDRILIRKNEDNIIHLYMYTEKHRYSITISDNYLGCIMRNRFTEIGEDWQRGTDLHDGDYCIGSWKEIINSIIRHEVLFVK